MLTYHPDTSLVHTLDPRTKLFLQACCAFPIILASPTTLPAITLGVITITTIARLDLTETIYSYRYVAIVLLIAPVLEGLTIQPPWFSIPEAIPPALASYRVSLLILISAVYIHSTAPRDSRAAIQRTIPGKPGQFLAVGAMIIFHIFPRILTAITQRRAAMHARLSQTRPITRQIELFTTNILILTFQQSDQYSKALQSRCFAWNPTLPPLRFDRTDILVILLGILIVTTTLLTSSRP